MKTERILLYFFHPDHTDWIALDASGKVLTLPFPINSQVTVIIPSEDVVLTSVILPKLSAGKLRQALPYALEEKLVDDIHELHFAIGPIRADGSVPVAIISQKKMAAWTERFLEMQITPNVMLPDMFLLPFSENTWHINICGNKSLARLGEWEGFGSETHNLDTYIQLKQHEASHSNLIQSIQIEKTEMSDVELLKKSTFSSFINLLQGPYHPKPERSQTKRNWSIAALLFAGTLAVLFLSHLVSFFILHHQEKKLTENINQIYLRHFPSATSITAPRERMEKKWREVSGQAAKNNFLSALVVIGNTLKQFPGITIHHLDFRGHTITLETSAQTFETLDQFVSTLSKQGFKARQENAAAAGSRVKASLLIQTGTA